MAALTPTPGPWQIKDDYTPEGRVTIIANIDGEYFTDSPSPRMTYDTVAVCEDEFGERLENAEANARLIASAPRMLEALRHVEATMAIIAPRSHMNEYLAALTDVRAAMATAEGR